jgi:hypothetical protein
MHDRTRVALRFESRAVLAGSKLSFYMALFQEDSSEEVGSATASFVAKMLAGQFR